MQRIRFILRALDPRNSGKTRREQRMIFRIRRIAATSMAVLLVVATLTFYSVHALGVRAATAARSDGTSAAQSDAKSSKKSASAKAGNGSEKKQSSGKKSANGKSTARQDDAVTKALAAQSAALQDNQKAEIRNKAEQTAQNSGHDVVEYRYCVATKGNVGNVEEFSNAAYRILNDERGWPRAGVVFEQSEDADGCDFNLVLSEAKYMKSFSSGCSEEYSCRVGQNVIINDDRWNKGTESWLSAGGSLARYRVMVINHEVGHRLGHTDNETPCSGTGNAAPLMQEQSMHLDGCSINEYPLDSELWTR